MNPRKLFHYVSYLQYPLAIIGFLIVLKPYFTGFEHYREDSAALFKDLNTVLILMGLAISFSSLQDTTKTQNRISRKIWQNPIKGKAFLIIVSSFALGLIIAGLIGFLKTGDSKLKELSIGIIILGLGFIGLLKSALEMFENHRLDKNKSSRLDNI